MLKHAIAREGCTDTVGESALKVDSGGKILCRTRESDLPQRRAGPTLYIPSRVQALRIHSFQPCTIIKGKGDEICERSGLTHTCNI